jgi:hypothetical protein
MVGTQFTALAVVVLITASCKGPAPPSPADLARSAAKARAAAAKSSAPPPPAAPATPASPKPVLSLQEFSADVPPGLCAPVRGGSCALDHVANVPAQTVTVVKRQQDSQMIGWAADTEAGTVPPVVLMQLSPPGDPKAEDKKAPASKAPVPTPQDKKQGKVFFVPAMRITKRVDVADTLKVPAFVDAGYDLLASFKNVPASEYSVSIVQVTAGGKAMICDTGRRLKVE